MFERDMLTDGPIVAHIPPSILTWRELKDAHVRHDQFFTGTFARDVDEFEICY